MDISYLRTLLALHRPQWSKLWIKTPRPSDNIGAYSTEQLKRMNQKFTAGVEHAFRAGGDSEMAATATYNLKCR
jgi:hypothetical protein